MMQSSLLLLVTTVLRFECSRVFNSHPLLNHRATMYVSSLGWKSNLLKSSFWMRLWGGSIASCVALPVWWCLGVCRCLWWCLGVCSSVSSVVREEHIVGHTASGIDTKLLRSPVQCVLGRTCGCSRRPGGRRRCSELSGESSDRLFMRRFSFWRRGEWGATTGKFTSISTFWRVATHLLDTCHIQLPAKAHKNEAEEKLSKKCFDMQKVLYRIAFFERFSLLLRLFQAFEKIVQNESINSFTSVQT